MPNVADEIGANDFDAACLRIQAAAHMVATLCPGGAVKCLGVSSRKPIGSLC